MAGAVVSYVIQKIDAIINQALFERTVKLQALQLNRELTGLESFLQDADAKARGGNESVQNWVKEVREAAHDAEDLIESIAIQGPEQGMGVNFMAGGPIPGDSYWMKIEELQKRIIKIGERAAQNGITDLPDYRCGRSDVEKAIAGGMVVALHASNSSHATKIFTRRTLLMEREKDEILSLLNSEEKRRSVVSIVGMGDLWKTTLARKVFKDPCIRRRFKRVVWIDVSQDYEDVKLLKDLLRRISPRRSVEFERMEKTRLESCVHELLRWKTYLIVMDDVRDGEVWWIFEKHLPDNGNGSRVLITTRTREVADAFKLRFLNQKESWKLFLSKAIPREEDRSQYTGQLKKLGKQMADKCGGLPLALVFMGGLLSQKQRSIAEWERVYESMVRQEEGEGYICKRILRYLDLPYDLQRCFLYLCAFPEDFEIESDRLFRLWIAEGFIAERGYTQTLEETAEIQLEKLIERSLVHVVKPEHYGGVIRCRVHDLLRELCIFEAQEIDFMSVHEGTRRLPAELSHRRLSVITGPEDTISFHLRFARRLRALLGFNFHQTATMNLFVGRLELIRVIDLQGAQSLRVLPDEIGRLVNLRYLSLAFTSIMRLPETIKNLSRLQFLDVRQTPIKEMTSAVWEIETLRQVFFPTNASIPYMGQCRWRSLQVLCGANAEDLMNESLHQMKEIKTLEILHIDAFHNEVLSLYLPQFSHLKILKLEGSSIPWTALMLRGLRLLRTLVLDGPIKSTFLGSLRDLCSLEHYGFVLNYAWPAGLTYLELARSYLHRDPLPSLGQLSELRFLSLTHDVYSWRGGIKFRGDGFKQLQKLQLSSLQQVNRIVVEGEAMPCLQNLELSGLQKVEEMTVEAGALPRLQELELRSLDRLERMIVEHGAMPRLQKLKISYCGRLETIPRRLEDVAEWD